MKRILLVVALLFSGVADATTPGVRVNGVQLPGLSSGASVVTQGLYWNSVDGLPHMVIPGVGDRPISVLDANYGVDTLAGRDLYLGATNAIGVEVGSVSHPIGLGVNIVPAYGFDGNGGGMRLRALSTPVSPTVTPTGGTGTGWCYQVAAVDAFGNRTMLPAQTCASGPATLTASAFMTIGITPINGATGYDIIRSGAGGTPSTVGAIAFNTSSTSFNDTGLTAAVYTTPDRNGTADLTIDGDLAIGTRAGGDGNWATTKTQGFGIENLTPATAGVPVQYSPCLTLTGNAWNTTAVASQPIVYWLCVTPFNGSSVSGSLVIYQQINGGAISTVGQFSGTTLFPGNGADNSGTVGSNSVSPSQVFQYRNVLRPQTVAAAASVTIAPSSGDSVRLTLSATAITSLTISAGFGGETMILEIIQDGTGGRTLPASWTNVKFIGGSYTVTATASKRDIMTLVYDATDANWYCRALTQNL